MKLYLKKTKFKINYNKMSFLKNNYKINNYQKHKNYKTKQIVK